MAENELALWYSIAAVVGGAAAAGIMQVPIWKGAVVIAAGLLVSMGGAAIFSPVSNVATLALFIIGSAAIGGALQLSWKPIGAMIFGSLAVTFLAGALIKAATG